MLGQVGMDFAGESHPLASLVVLTHRTGRTDASGKVQFVEGVGPAPCNSLQLKLPDRGMSTDLGCHNGGKTLEHQFTVATGVPSKMNGYHALAVMVARWLPCFCSRIRPLTQVQGFRERWHGMLLPVAPSHAASYNSAPMIVAHT